VKPRTKRSLNERYATRFYDTAVWHATSKRVLERDNFVCQIRLPGCTHRATVADHIVEREDGGADLELTNLQAACRRCNVAKRNTALAARAKRANVRARQW